MNDLEQELSSLKPVSPPDGLEARLEEALGEAGNVAVKRTVEQSQTEMIPMDGRTTLLSWLAPLAIAAAVALGAFLAVTRPVAEKTPSTRAESLPMASMPAVPLPVFPGEGWEASEATDHFLGGRDEGVVHQVGQPPARRFRYRFLDETIWRHPQANAVIRSTVPREEVVLVGLEPY